MLMHLQSIIYENKVLNCILHNNSEYKTKYIALTIMRFDINSYDINLKKKLKKKKYQNLTIFPFFEDRICLEESLEKCLYESEHIEDKNKYNLDYSFPKFLYKQTNKINLISHENELAYEKSENNINYQNEKIKYLPYANSSCHNKLDTNMKNKCESIIIKNNSYNFDTPEFYSTSSLSVNGKHTFDKPIKFHFISNEISDGNNRKYFNLQEKNKHYSSSIIIKKEDTIKNKMEATSDHIFDINDISINGFNDNIINKYVYESFLGCNKETLAYNKHQKRKSEEDKFTINLERISKGFDKRTTCMIKNIPNKYTVDLLIHLLNENHFGTYDFVYLRMDFSNGCNTGYAFVNFLDCKTVISFYNKINGKGWKKFNSKKIAELRYASDQGIETLIRKFSGSSIMLQPKAYQPKLFYKDGPSKGLEIDSFHQNM
ncbi:Protein MEI2-like 3 [Astathelohania contejeani]|uniref:Protein MEI2-like 3 n=1 Tax=Astathelohania contejeani TaxID=164912 RepID=A0ABQ7I1M1_9MICR|nr:Protein MEI2-like 3 [Thelohania contejeani]